MNKTPNRQKKNKTRTVTAPQGWTRAEVESVLGTVMMCAVSLSALLLTLAVFVSAVKMK